MTEALPTGEKRTPSYYTVFNTPAELMSSEPAGNLAATLYQADGVTVQYTLWGRVGGSWVSLAAVNPALLTAGVGSVDGVTPAAAGGNVDLVAGASTTVTPDNTAKTITFAVSQASETVLGTVEQATAAEVLAGTAGNLVATVTRLKAELDRRRVVEYFFDAQLAANQDLGVANASTKVIFGQENTDVGAWYNPVTGLATIPVTGLYRLYASMRWDAPATGETGQVQYSVNGAAGILMNLTRFSGTTNITSDFEIELPFTAAQTVEIRAETSLGTINAVGAPSTRFQMRYVGPLA